MSRTLATWRAQAAQESCSRVATLLPLFLQCLFEPDDLRFELFHVLLFVIHERRAFGLRRQWMLLMERWDRTLVQS